MLRFYYHFRASDGEDSSYDEESSSEEDFEHDSRSPPRAVGASKRKIRNPKKSAVHTATPAFTSRGSSELSREQAGSPRNQAVNYRQNSSSSRHRAVSSREPATSRQSVGSNEQHGHHSAGTSRHGKRKSVPAESDSTHERKRS